MKRYGPVPVGLKWLYLITETLYDKDQTPYVLATIEEHRGDPLLGVVAHKFIAHSEEEAKNIFDEMVANETNDYKNILGQIFWSKKDTSTIKQNKQ